MTIKDYAMLAAKSLLDKKADDVLVIDIQGKAPFADYFVICSGNSERQVASLADEVEDKLAEKRDYLLNLSKVSRVPVGS